MKMPTVVEAIAGIRSGRLTAEALTHACIDAIERHNPALNAFVHRDYESGQPAQASARAGPWVTKVSIAAATPSGS